MTSNNLWKALHDFENAHLYEGSIRVLREFGLASDRVADLDRSSGSLDDFLEHFKYAGKNLTENEYSTIKMLVHEIFFLFQATRDEIRLVPSCGEDGGIVAHSAIFIAADIRCSPGLTQGELQSIIRALNKGFGPPAIGRQYGVTRERIRQIEAKALRKLRHPAKAEKLRGFLDSPHR